MTYHEAIEAAKKWARFFHMNYVVFEYRRKHWWQRRIYDYTPASWFSLTSTAKLLTITPNGTISQ